MGVHTGDELLRLPVRAHGIQLGRPVDLILDAGAQVRALGFDVLCGDDEHRFLPFAAAVVRGDEIDVGSTLLLLEGPELRYYRDRGQTLRAVRGAAVARRGQEVGELRDLIVNGDGAIVEVVVGTNGDESRLDYGADVEDALGAAKRERLADHRDHVRLRDRLAVADRQRRVVIGTRSQPLGDEELARDTLHRREHALVGDVARAQLRLDHQLPLRVSEHRNAIARATQRR
jgi:hypothetical protein